MDCPNCGKPMETGWMMPGKFSCLEWAPARFQFPFPRKNRIKLLPAEPTPDFDFVEYPTLICQNCKTVLFQYQ